MNTTLNSTVEPVEPVEKSLIESAANAEYKSTVFAAMFKGNMAMGITVLGAATYQVVMVVPGVFLMLEKYIKEIAIVAG